MTLEDDSREKKDEALNKHPLLKALLNVDFNDGKAIDNLDRGIDAWGRIIYSVVGNIGESSLIRTMATFGSEFGVFNPNISMPMRIRITQALHFVGYELGDILVEDFLTHMEKLEEKLKDIEIFNRGPEVPNPPSNALKFILTVVTSGARLRKKDPRIKDKENAPEVFGPFKDLIEGLDELDGL